jgi:DnaK suppressor protein
MPKTPPRKPTLDADLKQVLTRSRSQVQADVLGRIRDGRTDRTNAVRDMADSSDENLRQAMDLTLLQMRAATLTHIDDALGRIDAGRYGVCVECDDHITEGRLRALPFAVRCRDCETSREMHRGRARHAELKGGLPFSSL